MKVKITILGLGQIGASIGLALANHKDQVTTLGHDLSPEIARKAQKLGAVEKIEYNLPASVQGADVVVLALPLDQIHETLKFIAEDVREEAVVMDTAPVKTVVAAWVKELLPPKRHYIGLTPALNPLVLEETGMGIDVARADLFYKGLVAVTAPDGTVDEALKLAADFVTLLGARPYFVDMAEVDGIMAAAHLLPGLAAAALVETVTGQPGWADIRKLAGKPFAAASRVLEGEEPAALAELALQNRVNTVRVLDGYIATLKSLRGEIVGEEKKNLQTRLDQTRKNYEQWRRERGEGNWQLVEFGGQEMPKASDIWKQQVGGLGKFFERRRKKLDEG
jgi:prephenate dehydrogenase